MNRSISLQTSTSSLSTTAIPSFSPPSHQATAETVVDDTPQIDADTMLLATRRNPSIMGKKTQQNSNNNKRSHLQCHARCQRDSDADDDGNSTIATDAVDHRHDEERPAKKKQRTVKFAELAQFRPIPARCDMHPFVLQQLYMSENDMRETKADIVQTIR
eukprot:CAMPEP_0119556510 /NCGR_PEP_ID=MMETSP1352-20130426/8434_1 /TAXON_ID=265584 /ORGANISM="Stauroneis constricta, Strain CCMP1120" /LENGTH=159 /DNA_ID=CAMNT_0007603475 /DNA_START=377 /DNA_END=852 /DNA_ORIENTATION=-